MLSFFLPFLPKNIIKRRFSIDKKLKNLIDDSNQSPQPRLILIPHCTHLDAITVLPQLAQINNPQNVKVLFRSFNNKLLNKWIVHSRERYGFSMLSRKSGLMQAKECLKNNGTLAMLFDQNAKFTGVLSNFCNQIASTTPLPQLLSEHYNCEIHVIYPKYKKFFSSQFTTEKLSVDHISQDSVTKNMNLWLEKKLKSDLKFSQDWLWMHNRWNILSDEKSLFNIKHKRKIENFESPTHTTKALVRIPKNSLNIDAIIETIEKIQQNRKDLKIYLMIDKNDVNYRTICKSLQLHIIPAEQILECRKKCFRYFITFENSWKTKLEKILIGAAKNINIATI
jgi:lauroyl/myristoyl acyltransferase